MSWHACWSPATGSLTIFAGAGSPFVQWSRYHRAMWLISFLARQSGQDPLLRSRTWSVAALVLPTMAMGLLLVSVSAGSMGGRIADGLAYASAVVSCASIACGTAVVPIWLGRLDSRDRASRVVDVALWAVPGALTIVASIGALFLMERAYPVAGDRDGDAFVAGAVALLSSAMFVGFLSTVWGLRLSVERGRRRLGWRPAQEIADERFAELERSSAETAAAIDAMLAMPEPQIGEIAVCEVILDDPALPWRRLIATNQRLLLRGESEWTWRDHRDLADVVRGAADDIVLEYRNQAPVLAPGGSADMRALTRYLKTCISR